MSRFVLAFFILAGVANADVQNNGHHELLENRDKIQLIDLGAEKVTERRGNSVTDRLQQNHGTTNPPKRLSDLGAHGKIRSIPKRDDPNDLPAPIVDESKTKSKTNDSLYADDLHPMVDEILKADALYLNMIAFPEEYKRDLKLHPFVQQRVKVKEGEIRAILKRLLRLPPHLFGREFDLQIDTKEIGKLKFQLIDKETQKPLGTVKTSTSGELISVGREDQSMAELERIQPNNFTDGSIPRLMRLGALSRKVYHERFLSPRDEGEMEYLAKEAFNVPVSDRRLDLFTTFYSGRNFGYESTLMEFRNDVTGKRLGVLAFNYGTGDPNRLLSVHTIRGETARVEQLVPQKTGTAKVAASARANSSRAHRQIVSQPMLVRPVIYYPSPVPTYFCSARRIKSSCALRR